MPADPPIPARLVTIYTLVASPKGPPWKVALAEELTRQALTKGQTRPGSYRHFYVYRYGEPYPHLAAEGRIGQYEVEKIATTLRYQKNVGWTAALEVGFSAADWDGVIQAAKDAYDKNRVTIFLDGMKLLYRIRQLAVTSGLKFGKERAQLLVVDQPGGPPGEDFDPVTDVDQRLLRQLLFKDTDIAYRPAWAPVSMPSDINGPEGTMVAVWATNTVVTGYDRLLPTRVKEMTERLSEAVIALEACNGVLSEADAEMAGLGGAEAEIAGQELAAHADALRHLQYRYTFAVERHLPHMGAKGGAPIESYYEAAAHELGLVDRAATTRAVIDRLAEAARAERDRREIVAALTRARDARITAVVAGTLGALLAAAGLFATLATIPSGHTLLHTAYRSAALAELLVVGAGGIGVLLALAALRRRQHGATPPRSEPGTIPPRSQPGAPPAPKLSTRWRLGAAVVAAVAAVLLAVAASGVVGNTAGWAIVAGASLMLVLALAGIVSKMTF
jgi:hypothetical protein